jgi:hypothetical protein
MSVVFATKMQKEVLESNEKLTVITAEPGAGSTTALLMKAWQVASDNQDVNVTFFVPTRHHINRAGSVKEYMLKIFGSDIRYSETSAIATLKNGSKIKFVACDGELVNTMGLARDLMLFDANISKDFVLAHLFRAKQMVVIDSIENLEKDDSWANIANLLDKIDGKINGFCSAVKHITGTIEENFLFEGDREHYKELVMQAIPGRVKVQFGSK